MQERIKEHDRDIRLARTQTSAVSEHTHETGHYPLWNEVKFIDLFYIFLDIDYFIVRKVPTDVNYRITASVVEIDFVFSCGQMKPLKAFVNSSSSNIPSEGGLRYRRFENRSVRYSILVYTHSVILVLLARYL